MLGNSAYAGNFESLATLKRHPSHVFAHGGIGNTAPMSLRLTGHGPQAALNFAAESCIARIIFVQNRPDHGKRYALHVSHPERGLCWKPVEAFETHLA